MSPSDIETLAICVASVALYLAVVICVGWWLDPTRGESGV